MALFSRRGKPEDAQPAESDATVAPDEATQSDPDAATPPTEKVPEVGISISTFGAPPAATTRPVTPTRPAAPAQGDGAPAGPPQNAPLKAALAALPARPQPADVMNVMRQALQGSLFLRAKGDAKALIEAGQPLTLAVTMIEDKRVLLAFSGVEALQESLRGDGDTQTSAVSQPVQAVFRQVLDGSYAGLFLDHATEGARLILPAELIAKAVEEADPELTLKNLLAAQRTDETVERIVAELTRVKLWVAGNTDESGRMGIAEARSADGRRRLEVFSHPLEVIALGRGDRPLPVTAAQFAKALASDDGISGIVVDPAGPWIEITRDRLGALLALVD